VAITQKFIAKKVGVSQKTVSLYFKDHGSPHVASETCKRIKRIAEEYGYFPNLAAQSIKTQSFKRIAFVNVQHDKAGVQGHPHLLAYINAAAHELGMHGYSLVHESFTIDLNTLDFTEQPNFFKNLSVDGIIGMAGTYVPPLVDETIDSMGRPVVWLNRHRFPNEIPYINFDEVANGRRLAIYLKEKGYQRIAWFGPEFQVKAIHHHSAANRCDGVRQICRENGMELVEAFARVGQNLLEAAPALFDSPTRPQAVVCYNFDYADAAGFSMMQKGLKHPDDIEIVKFSSEWESSMATAERYSRLVLPEAELSRRGVRYILGTLADERDETLLRSLTGTLQIKTPSKGTPT
jgi:LacI family transcriptional regulator